MARSAQDTRRARKKRDHAFGHGLGSASVLGSSSIAPLTTLHVYPLYIALTSIEAKRLLPETPPFHRRCDATYITGRSFWR
jgi:hypothetical protein